MEDLDNSSRGGEDSSRLNSLGEHPDLGPEFQDSLFDSGTEHFHRWFGHTIKLPLFKKPAQSNIDIDIGDQIETNDYGEPNYDKDKHWVEMSVKILGVAATAGLGVYGFYVATRGMRPKKDK